ncbi:OsmC family protein [Nocardioides pocheonensis]|uniref:OsmC family peroxiredoxin n=1 Tax=Nocardioides pocheonensis TaxID=661485 RepID=A0A3N0GFF3_9ACTN|nr:OsmC family protein [Nocardioides pocheonensis]RNM11194.1 OsmC family peroxiredoxin [Nocardioides pocheonensis]
MTDASQPAESRADTYRSVELTRIGEHRYKATNWRGGVLPIGEGDDPDFTPVELLLAAIAGCAAIDVDYITGKRSAPEAFDVHVEGDKVRDEQGNHLTNLRVVFDVTFPEGEAGDAARSVLQSAIERSRDRICTVSRTVALPSPVAMEQASATPVT